MAGNASLEDPEVIARWSGFDWTDENRKKVAKMIARYPQGRQHSAVLPLLDVAQRQVCPAVMHTGPASVQRGQR